MHREAQSLLPDIKPLTDHTVSHGRLMAQQLAKCRRPAFRAGSPACETAGSGAEIEVESPFGWRLSILEADIVFLHA